MSLTSNLKSTKFITHQARPWLLSMRNPSSSSSAFSLAPILTFADKKPVHMHFYMQEKVTEPNATSIVIAKLGPIALPARLTVSAT
jgi:hypothetical protein